METSALAALQNAKHMLIGAGAGIGVDSGLPDFRGNEGFWKAYPPYRKLGFSFTQMASPRAFFSDPEFGWGFYGHRLNLYRSTIPHEGFEILKRWAEEKGSYFIHTSNVDGQFQKAGFDESRIYECHGSIHHFQCAGPCEKGIWPAHGAEIEVDTNTMRAEQPVPMCPNCPLVARPNILMFGDFAYLEGRSAEQRRRYIQWINNEVGDEPLIIVELGAGTTIPSVRMESEQLAMEPSATLIRINPRESQVPPGNFGIAKGALDGLRALTEA